MSGPDPKRHGIDTNLSNRLMSASHESATGARFIEVNPEVDLICSAPPVPRASVLPAELGGIGCVQPSTPFVPSRPSQRQQLPLKSS